MLAHRVVGDPRPSGADGLAEGGGGPASANLELDGRRGPGLRAGRAGAVGRRSRRSGRRRRDRDPRQQGHRRRPGLAARAGTGRRRSWRTPERGKPVLGVCGGFQMLCRRIDDTVESRTSAASTVSRCSTPTSSSIPTRRCATTKPRFTATKFTMVCLGRSTEDDWARGVAAFGLRRGLRNPLARSARQRRREAAMAHRRRRCRRP